MNIVTNTTYTLEDTDKVGVDLLPTGANLRIVSYDGGKKDVTVCLTPAHLSTLRTLVEYLQGLSGEKDPYGLNHLGLRRPRPIARVKRPATT